MLHNPTEQEIKAFVQDFLLKRMQCPDYRLGQAWINYFDPPYEFHLYNVSDEVARHQLETIYAIDFKDFGL